MATTTKTRREVQGEAVRVKPGLVRLRRTAAIYRVAPPVKYHKLAPPDYKRLGLEEHETDHVLVSLGGDGRDTSVFPADEVGNVLDWGHIGRAETSTASDPYGHASALADAGYKVRTT
jgi:hypothetical protein